jgi:hypothetical protein
VTVWVNRATGLKPSAPVVAAAGGHHSGPVN